MTSISKLSPVFLSSSTEWSLTRESALKIGAGLVGALGLGYLAYSRYFDCCSHRHLTNDRRKSITSRQSYPLLDQIPELNSPHVHIKDKERVELILNNIKQAGKQSLQVVSDFDRTISLCSYQGQSCPTSFGILQHSPLVDPELSRKLNELFDHYYPIEHDHSLTKEEKVPFMIEWWDKANQIIVDTGLTRQQLRHIIQSSMTHLKHNCKLFFKRLEDNQIPCLVFSAGLGDVIEEWMEHECDGSYSNMKVVSNFMDFDSESGRIKGFKGEMIHVYNKNEGVLLDTDYEKIIHSRPNVILLGDSLGDTEMANGFPSLNNIIKIGFLNLKVDILLPQYMDAFDIVLVTDDSFDIPNALLKHLF